MNDNTSTTLISIGLMLTVLIAVFFVTNCVLEKHKTPLADMTSCTEKGGSWVISRSENASQGQMECHMPGFKRTFKGD